jgi:hypothetical protein
MKRASELINDAVALLEARGFVPIVCRGGKHVRIRWFDGSRRFTLYIPATPSDVRARLNSRAVLRRILRANGGAV